MQIYNNWTRGGMKSEKVHFSRFFEIFNLQLTQFNIISPRACRVPMETVTSLEFVCEHFG